MGRRAPSGLEGRVPFLRGGHKRREPTQVVPRVQRIEGRFAVIEVEQSGPSCAEDEVRGPHGEPGIHEVVVPGLLAEADENVVDEDDGDGEGERRRSRFLPAP